MDDPNVPPEQALDPEQEELLALLAAEEKRASAGFPIRRREIDQPAPLGFAQEQLWFLHSFDPSNRAYQIMSVYRLRGRVDRGALENAWNECVRRHEALRTTFRSRGGRPVQIVHPFEPCSIPLRTILGTTEEERLVTMHHWMSEAVARPFDLEAGPLFRVEFYELGPEDFAFGLISHHIAIDGSSLGILAGELSLLYTASIKAEDHPLPPVPFQPAEHALWQQEQLVSPGFERQLAYWRQTLKGELPILELPTDFPRPARQTFKGSYISWRIAPEPFQPFKNLCQRERVTTFMGLVAVFTVFLYRWSRMSDILVGCASGGRHHSGMDRIVGMFVNMVVLRSDLSDDPTFEMFLRRTRDRVLSAFEHQDVPFERVVQELQPKRRASHSPIFQVGFSHIASNESELELPGVRVDPVGVQITGAKFDLMLNVFEGPHGLDANFEYSTDLFTEQTVRRMSDSFNELLRGASRGPNLRLSVLPLLSQEDRRRILMDSSIAESETDGPALLHSFFDVQTIQNPEACAVVAGEDRCTYRELQQRADRLARHLRRAGVKPEVLVGLCLERSVSMVVGILAVLRAGGGYVPLDASYPAERIAFMLEDSRAKVLLTQRTLLGGLPPHRATLVLMDEVSEDNTHEDAERNAKPEPSNVAYVIYTSGSTGIPKGVIIEHRSAAALIRWALKIYPPEELAGVLFSTSICFDLSIFELFVTLAAGGKVIIAENAIEMARLKAADEVTLINTVPSAMRELLRRGAVSHSVRVVNLAGEPLTTALVDQIYEMPSIVKVYDLYGPTEDTTYSTFALRQRGQPPTIGRPISNTRVYILDPACQPVPIGVPGEIYLGGDGLARGYLHRSELTAEKFLTDPFSTVPGARYYRTGDLGRFRIDGSIEFMGRLDHQVKVRGFRIELGEIEAVLNRHDSVKQCVVVVREDIPGDPRITAYYETKSGEPVSSADLRSYLKSSLPDYMIPSVFVPLTELPLTLTGKIDRKALPAVELERHHERKEWVAPRSASELKIANIWRGVLKRDEIGIYDDFFELGGHSLNALQLVHQVSEALGISIRLQTLFDFPTVAEFTEAVESLRSGTSS